MILKQIEFTADVRNFKKGQVIPFQKPYHSTVFSNRDNLTMISGDNGSGKTTLLNCIREHFTSSRDEVKDKDHLPFWYDFSDYFQFNGWGSEDRSVYGNTKVTYDSDNWAREPEPGEVLYKPFSQILDLNLGLPIERAACLGVSSGISAFTYLAELFKHVSQMKGIYSLVAIDEPERGLSQRNQLIMANVLWKELQDPQAPQFIIATHSPIFLKMVNNMYSCSHMKYIGSQEYIDWSLDKNSIEQTQCADSK